MDIRIILLTILFFIAMPVSAATILYPGGGGTGNGTAPTYGQMLVGNSSGTYTPTATSSLGITASAAWGSITGTLSNQTDLSNSLYSKLGTTSSLTAGHILYTSGTNTVADEATSSVTYSSPLTTSGTAGYIVGGSGFAIGCQTASGSQAGCLSSTDWTTFNNKQSALTFSLPLLNTAGTVSTLFSTTTDTGLGASKVLYTNASGILMGVATSSSSQAGAFVVRDANQNAFAQNFVSAGTSFPTNGGTVTLTNASPRSWIFTGTNTQTMKLPSGTTLSVGATYTANNNSTLNVTVVDNGSNTLATVLPGGKTEFVISDTSTTNGSWDAHALLGHGMTAGTSLLNTGSANASTSQFTTSGTAWIHDLTLTTALSIANGGTGLTSVGASSTVATTNGTSIAWQKLDLGAAVYGTLPLANGGTNASLSGASDIIAMNSGNTALTTNSGYTLTSSLLTAPNASTTNATVATSLQIPNSSSPSLSAAGYVAANTSSASSSLQYYDGTAQRGLYDVTDLSFTFVNYPTNGTGTTTFTKLNLDRGTVLTNGGCYSVGGTANVQVGNGSASTTMLAAANSLPTVTTFSSNNSFDYNTMMYFAIGTFSSSGTTTVSCSYGQRHSY